MSRIIAVFFTIVAVICWFMMFAAPLNRPAVAYLSTIGFFISLCCAGFAAWLAIDKKDDKQ